MTTPGNSLSPLPDSATLNSSKETAAKPSAPLEFRASTVASVHEGLLTTPQMLTLFVLISWLACLGFGLGGVSAAREGKAGYTSILGRSIPSIASAQELRAGLAELDTAAANQFLSSAPSLQSGNEKVYAERQQSTINHLVSTANDLPTNSPDLNGVKELFQDLQKYFALVEKAKTFQELQKPGAVAIFIKASNLMHSRLLSRADDLSQAKEGILEATFPVTREHFNFWSKVTVYSGCTLLACLILLQLYLRIKTRRLCNPLLLTGSVTSALALFYFIGWSLTTLSAIDSAKNIALQKVKVLWSIRSAANECNRGESLYLLNELTEERDFSTFKHNADQVAELTSEPENLADSSSAAMSRVKQSWREYLTIDGQIRELAEARQHEAAVRLCLGTNAHESEWAFRKLDNELAQQLAQLSDSLSESESKGLATSKKYLYLIPIVSLCVAFFAWQGVQPRLREYGS